MGLAELEQLVVEPEQKKPNITALEDLIAGGQALPAETPAAPQQIAAEPETERPGVETLGGLTQRGPPSISSQSRPMTDFEALQFAGQPSTPTLTRPLSPEQQQAAAQPIINRMLRKVQEDEDIERQAQQLSQSVSFGIADELIARNEPGASGDIFGLGKLAARAGERFADITQGPLLPYDQRVRARARQIRREGPLSLFKIAAKAPAFAADLTNFITELSASGAVLRSAGLTVGGITKAGRIIDTAGKFGFHGFLKSLSEGQSPGDAIVTGAAPRVVLGVGLGTAGPSVAGQLIAGPAAFAGSAALETTIQGGSRREIAENAGYSGLFGLAFGVVNTLTPHAIGFLKRLKRTNPQAYRQEMRKASPRVKQFVEAQPESPVSTKPPWEMTKEEFGRTFVFRGVNNITKNLPNTQWTPSSVDALDFAGRGGQRPVAIRMARVSDFAKVKTIRGRAGTGEFSVKAKDAPPIFAELPPTVRNAHKFFSSTAQGAAFSVRQASEAVKMAGFEPITAKRSPREIVKAARQAYKASLAEAAQAPHKASLAPTQAGKMPAEITHRALARAARAPAAAAEAIKQSRAVAAEKLMPSINVYAKPKDAGLLQRTALTLGNQIYNSGSKNVIAAGEDLLDTPMKMQDETRALLARDHTVMNKTVKKYSKRFFDWVEKPATPKQVRASRAIPADAKESVIHAKKTLEADRIEIRTRKRLMSAKIHSGQSIKDMQKAASERGVKFEVRPRGPKGRVSVSELDYAPLREKDRANIQQAFHRLQTNAPKLANRIKSIKIADVPETTIDNSGVVFLSNREVNQSVDRLAYVLAHEATHGFQNRKILGLATRGNTLTETQAERVGKAMQTRPDIVGKGTKARSLYDPETQQFVTKDAAASRLAKIDIPDDWGKQWEYMPHMFFGKYKLGWYDSSGKYRFIDRAETPAEATRKLKSFRELNPDIGAVRYEAKPDVFIPADMVRVSRGRYFHVVSEIQKAADLASKDITQGLRGTIGQKASKQKWAGFLQPRLGAKRYSKDFWKVWNLYRVQFQRWKYLSDLNRRVQPKIEAIRNEGLPLWADRLERDLDFVWGRYRSVTSEGVDQMIQRLPIINRFAKPYALERYAGALKSINYMRHLQTPRFYALNSMQVFQTLNPIVGEKQLAKGVGLYYSKAGKQILTRHNITDPAGKLHERWMLRHSRWERFLPASASEVRNQSISFLTMYDHARKLGLNDAAAARYGRLRGQLFTQFRYSPADIPPIMRAPISGLILQYKRFPIKNLEILGRLVRDHKIGGVGRWMLAQAALGGTRMFVRSIPIAGTGYLTLGMYRKTKNDYGKDTADLIHYGLPALIGGVDMSGSVNMFDIPMGRSVPEKLGNILLGPTGQTITRAIADAQEEKKLGHVSKRASIAKTLVETSPSIKQFVFLAKALDKDTSNLDAKGRQRYELTVTDLWKKAFGFRPMSESLQRAQIDAVFGIEKDRNKQINIAVGYQLDGDYAKAQEIIVRFNKMYPEFGISNAELNERRKARDATKGKSQLERMMEQAPQRIRRGLPAVGIERP